MIAGSIVAHPLAFGKGQKKCYNGANNRGRFCNIQVKGGERMRKDAVEELYRLYAPTVYKYLMCLCHDAHLAEDLTADTFEEALRGIHKFRGEAKLSVWLCGIAKRKYYMHLRKQGRVQAIPLENAPLISPEDIERDVLDRADKVDFYRALQALPPEAREVFYLRLSGDMTFEEIGSILGRSGNWARGTFYRGKEKLKRRLNEDGE